MLKDQKLVFDTVVKAMKEKEKENKELRNAFYEAKAQLWFQPRLKWFEEDCLDQRLANMSKAAKELPEKTSNLFSKEIAGIKKDFKKFTAQEDPQ